MLDQPVGHVFEATQSVTPSQRIHLVLLGVDDVARSARFYEALGWTRSPTGTDGFVKFIKQATRTDWGVAGYFKDPDGHLFEVDYETVWCFDEQHHLRVDHVNIV